MVCEGDRIVGVETIDGAISTGTIICAAGPWSRTLLAPLGVDLPISALRVQVAVLNRPLAFEPPHAAYIDAALGMFIRPWSPGQTMVGIRCGDQHDDVDPDDWDPRNTVGYGDVAIETIAKRMPIMANASYSHGHAGLHDMTPDAHPIIGPAGPDSRKVRPSVSALPK